MSAETVIESGGWCSICALPLIEYTQRYFMGSPINPTCDGCDDVDPEDVFASFPNDGIPPSLASHWTAFTSTGTLAHAASFKSHYVDGSQEVVSASDENFRLLEDEVRKWSEVFQQNLLAMLSRWDAAFAEMENKLDNL